MYKAVRTYTLLPGSTDEFLQRVQEGFVPLLSQTAGFIAYDTRHVGSDHVITISDFDTRAGAEESILRALRWVQENCPELVQVAPTLQVKQMLTPSKLRSVLQAQYREAEKTLVLDLTYEVIHPSALGAHAYSDPHVREMVTAIRRLLTQMRADPARHDQVIYRFEGDLLPEEATNSLYEADHVILIKRGSQLAGYIEIHRDTNPRLGRERYEGDILVDPAVYHRDAQGQIVEKGIGEQSLLEMRRQGLLLGINNIELDVHLRNQPMQRFLDHLIVKQRLPFTKQEMDYGRPLDYTYLLPCQGSAAWRKGDALRRRTREPNLLRVGSRVEVSNYSPFSGLRGTVRTVAPFATSLEDEEFASPCFYQIALEGTYTKDPIWFEAVEVVLVGPH